MFFVSVVCRFTTVAALLLHLIFGCSLHHAGACGHHDHDGCPHTCVSDSLAVHDEQDCGHDHGHGCPTEEDTVEPSVQLSQLVAPCCDCETQPCNGNHPGFHGEVECSFVPSSDIVFVINAPLIAFVIYEHDPMLSDANSLASRGLPGRSAIGAQDSLSHCAFLCTWII